jgi:hypothetical protein
VLGDLAAPRADMLGAAGAPAIDAAATDPGQAPGAGAPRAGELP